MNNNFTEDFWDGTLDINYKTWEEIPVSTLNFGNSKSQICYIALTKDMAIEAYNNKAVSQNTIAYEYVENMQLKDNMVILAVEVDTTDMLDLTNKNDYMQYMNCKLNNEKLDSKIALVRKVVIDKDTNQFQIVYLIRDNRCVKNIEKA